MLTSVSLQFRMSEIRTAMNAAPEMTDADREVKRAELVTLETEYRAALLSENASADDAFAQGSAEHRERQAITGKADLGILLGNVLARRNQSGAEAEAQEAWGIAGDQLPVAMLAELRVVAAPSEGGGPAAFSGYVFPASIAQFANIARPHMPAGAHVFPSFSTVAAAGRPAEGAAHGSTEPVIRGQLLTPARIHSVASVSVEDRGRFPGIGAALAVHLAGAVAAGLDQQALLGNNGFFDTSSGPLTEPTNPGSASGYTAWAAVLASVIDGRRSGTMAEGALLMHADGFASADTKFRITAAPESMAERLDRVTRLRVSAAMPAAASNVVSILSIRGRTPAAVQAIWPGISIEDIFSSSDNGQVKFSAVMLAAFSVQDTAAYTWQKVNVS